MDMKKPIRILWLLNHTTLRKFEVKQFKSIGINEIFLPKTFPYDEGNLSASIDFSLDVNLTIPKNELDILNQQNWYENPSENAWDIVNKYFDAIYIGFFPNQIKSVIRYFHGAIVLRVFGLAKGYTYTQLLFEELGPVWFSKLTALGDRFWFGVAYEHLADIEGDFLRARTCYLPVGLETNWHESIWTGENKKVFFVCPRIGTSPYFKSIYDGFKKNFGNFGYVIGGAQPIKITDPNVLGFVPRDVHEQNMRQLRVMFYHSTEPNHIHYHPFEAIQAGMPLVFMSGGLLDRFGGKDLPGRCRTIHEAQRKIKKILGDDWSLINSIRNSQTCLLDPMRPENCSKAWQDGFRRVLEGLDSLTNTSRRLLRRKMRIAVIVPVEYRGGSLRGAKMLAKAIHVGSCQAGEEVEVVFGYLENPATYSDNDFSDLLPEIHPRPFRWRTLNHDEANRAMTFAGHKEQLDSGEYQIPDDSIKQFLDCDLWVIISDRLERPLLPLRPYVLMIYDYLQRYVKFLSPEINQTFLRAAQTAERVFTTTEFTRRDAIQFAGLPQRKVKCLPMLAQIFPRSSPHRTDEVTSAYFIWTTNLALHKNHLNAFKALERYYTEFDGQLECRITGVGTQNLLNSSLPHLAPLKDIYNAIGMINRRVKILGELPDQTYRQTLQEAEFLWHAGAIDNGTFGVVEAASCGVPSLSSDYPAMREIDEQFQINLSWMNQYDPGDMARQLKWMEVHACELRKKLSVRDMLPKQSIEQLSGVYWAAVRECL